MKKFLTLAMLAAFAAAAHAADAPDTLGKIKSSKTMIILLGLIANKYYDVYRGKLRDGSSNRNISHHSGITPVCQRRLEMCNYPAPC